MAQARELRAVEEEYVMDMEPPTKPDATGNYPLPLPGITKLL